MTTLSDLVQVPSPQIPEALAELKRVEAKLLARLAQPEIQHTEEDPLLTASQVAERLRVDRKWVYRHAAKLGAVKLSRKKLRFPLSELERYLKRRRAASSAGRGK